MIIADTSGLLAFFNASEPDHDAVKEVVRSSEDVLAVSPYVVAELDYLVATRVGIAAELAVLKDLASGAYHLESFDAEALDRARGVVEQYRDQDIGIADASIVVLADRRRTKRILTLDRRHFSVLKALDGAPFTLLP